MFCAPRYTLTKVTLMRCKTFSFGWSIALANIALALMMVTAASAATEKVLYSFGNGLNAAYPFDTPIFDAAGNLYGTTWEGGTANHGTVFELSPDSKGGWTEAVLYSFQGGPTDGGKANGSVIFDASGNIYGTTRYGGGTSCTDCGTVFKLTPGNGTWTESLLYQFNGTKDGKYPYAGVIMDGLGNLYGTTNAGGAHHFGAVFELSPSKGGWTESTLLSFNGKDGNSPVAGLVMDGSGNLYGTTQKGGANNLGVVFELSPSKHGWKETVLHSFAGGTTDGSGPGAGVIFDTAGNLYGSTYAGGTGSCTNGCGTVFELSPGSVRTETIDSIPQRSQPKPSQQHSLRRAGQPLWCDSARRLGEKCTGGGCAVHRI